MKICRSLKIDCFIEKRTLCSRCTKLQNRLFCYQQDWCGCSKSSVSCRQRNGKNTCDPPGTALATNGRAKNPPTSGTSSNIICRLSFTGWMRFCKLENRKILYRTQRTLRRSNPSVGSLGLRPMQPFQFLDLVKSEIEISDCRYVRHFHALDDFTSIALTGHERGAKLILKLAIKLIANYGGNHEEYFTERTGRSVG